MRIKISNKKKEKAINFTRRLYKKDIERLKKLAEKYTNGNESEMIRLLINSKLENEQ